MRKTIRGAQLIYDLKTIRIEQKVSFPFPRQTIVVTKTMGVENVFKTKIQDRLSSER